MIAHPLDTRHEGAIATHQQAHLHPSLRCSVEPLDDLLVDDVIHLDVDKGGQPLICIPDLGVDQPDEAAAHGVGRDHQLPEVGRQVGLLDEVKDPLHITDQSAPSRHHHEVGVGLGIPLMHIAGTDAGDVTLPCLDESQLAVDLEVPGTEEHPHAGVSHLLGKGDVALLIKSRQQLDHTGHFLAVTCRSHQSLDDRGVLRHAVDRRLDLLHVFTDRRLLEHPDKGVEAVVGEVEPLILTPDRVKHTSLKVRMSTDDRVPGGV